MAHECEECGLWCYCDMDDIGGMPQPNDCPHLIRHMEEEIGDDCEEIDGIL